MANLSKERLKTSSHSNVGRTVAGGVLGSLAGVALGLLTVRGIPAEGLNTGEGLLSRSFIFAAYLGAGLMIGLVAGFLSPAITSAWRAALLGAILGAPLMLIGFAKADPLFLETSRDWWFIGVVGALMGASVGAFFMWSTSGLFTLAMRSATVVEP